MYCSRLSKDGEGGVEWLRMFISRLHEIAPPPVDPVVLHRRHRRRRKTTQWGTVVIVLGIAGAFVWWYLGTGTDSAQSVQSNRNVVVNAEKDASNETPVPSLADSDSDGLSDVLEATYGSDRDNVDTDGDGYQDGVEVENGFNPLNPGTTSRMVDLGLVGTIAKANLDTSVVSSGVSTANGTRHYLLFDGTSTTYYAADGTVEAQCPLNSEPKDACTTLPNEIRTDFSRTYDGDSSVDVYHIPF